VVSVFYSNTKLLKGLATDTFIEDFVFISKEVARFLVEHKVSVIGLDYLSVGSFKRDGNVTHQILLEGGVWIIEGLDLSSVKPGKYDLICLPLKVDQGDGAPARAILKAVRGGKGIK
jgi:arylformamidase